MNTTRLNELFAHFYNCDQERGNFRSSTLKMYRRKVFYCRYIGTLLKIFSRPPKQAKYIFIGGSYLRDLIGELPREEVVVLGGLKQALYCWKHSITFRLNCEGRKVLYDCLKGKQRNNVLEQTLYYLTNFFKCNFSSDAVLITDTDSPPLERLYITAARDAGILTICIQHGLFQKNSPSYLPDGKFADYMFVFDQRTRDLLIEKGTPSERLCIMGYRSNPYYPKKVLCKENRQVCILGAPWRFYSQESHNKHFDIFVKLCKVFKEHNVKYCYKPHPLEYGESYLKTIDNIFKGNLNEAFEQFDVFVAVSSTGLYEATLAGRVAIQIRASELLVDDFAEAGYAYSIDSSKIEDILSILNSEPILQNTSSLEPVSTRFKKCLLSKRVLDSSSE